MNKIIKILLIIILLFIIISLTAVMAFFIKNDFRDFNMELIDSYETEVGEIDRFYLELNSTDIEIKESQNDKILVEYYSNTDTDVKIENKDNNIVIEESKNDKKIKRIFFNNRKKVILFVPETYVGEYELKTKSGDIKSEIDLSNNKVNISSNSGDVSLKAVSNIDISTSSGDIEIYQINKESKINSSSGDICIDILNIEENSSITSTSGDVTIRKNQSDCYIETDTEHGDVEVNKNDRKSDIVLKIKTTSGDISVD